MRIDIGETENHAYERAKEATYMLLLLLIEHHGDGLEIMPSYDEPEPIELEPLIAPDLSEIPPEKSWIKRQLTIYPRLKKPKHCLPASLGPSIQEIQLAVIAEFPVVTLMDVNSARREQAVVRPRQIAMYLAKRLTPRSLPDIGRRFGGRDHTTVIHAVNKIAGLIKSDPIMAAQIERIKGSLAEATA